MRGDHFIPGLFAPLSCASTRASFAAVSMLASRFHQSSCSRGGGFGTLRHAAHQPQSAWCHLQPRRSCQLQSLVCRVATPSHYDVLGVATESSDEEIKTAFRRAAKRFHPDVNKEPGAEARFMRINQAYSTLSDPKQRRQYDSDLLAARSPRSPSGAAGRGSSRNGWVEYTWVVNVDDDDDDEDDTIVLETDEDVLEYFKWATTGQNLRSSYQSSWQANSKKQRQRQQAEAARGGKASQQQQQQQGARAGAAAGKQRAKKQEVTETDRRQILSSLLDEPRMYAQKVFGARLEHLESWKQMDDFLDVLETMHIEDMGLHHDDSDDDTDLFDSDSDDEGWVRPGKPAAGSSRQRSASGSAASGRASAGTRRSSNRDADIDWDSFVVDFDTGSASASRARRAQGPASPRSGSSGTSGAGRGQTSGARSTGARASGSASASADQGVKGRTPPRKPAPRRPVVEDLDDEIDAEELEELLNVFMGAGLADDGDLEGPGRRRAAARRPRRSR